MDTRQKFFAALRRQGTGYVPFDFSLCPAHRVEFKQRTGQDDYEAYYGVPVRWVWAEYSGEPGRFARYHPGLAEDAIWPDWGIGSRKGSVAHFEKMLPPMENFQSLADFEAYPYPEPLRDYAWAAMAPKVAAIRDQDCVSVAPLAITIFEIAWYLRGMETFLMDLIVNPEWANYHLDRITAIRCAMARQYAAAGCDVLQLGDDVSTQQAMMMKPATWRTFFKPRLAQVIQAAKSVKPDLLIYYHGDGNCQAIIPELIEIGVEVLNPIQPECMDPIAIKRQYGDRLSFCGTLGTQTTLPFGTPAEVRRVCEQMIREVGRGGGLWLAPTHMVEPEVPWENVQAFIDTVHEHNQRYN